MKFDEMLWWSSFHVQMEIEGREKRFVMFFNCCIAALIVSVDLIFCYSIRCCR